ncbi:MAG: hypothetical protein KBC30_04570 [Planctomycetes bacterium]|nr:hypothetical protein [Planctomycetota bacterium]
MLWGITLGNYSGEEFALGKANLLWGVCSGEVICSGEVEAICSGELSCSGECQLLWGGNVALGSGKFALGNCSGEWKICSGELLWGRQFALGNCSGELIW